MDYLTVTAAARRLKISPRRVRQLIEEGILPVAVTHAKLYLIDPSALELARGRKTTRGRAPKK